MPTLMIWDCECDKCNHVFEAWASGGDSAPICPACESAFTRLLPGGVKSGIKAKDPYDYLDKGIPTSPVTVGPHKNKRRKK